MSQTDRQTDRTTRWAFTAYEGQWALFNTMPSGIAEWGWNAEICPDTNTPHYQGYLRTTAQQRHAWLRKLFPGVHIEVAKNWEALKKYCAKEATRMPGTTPVSQVNPYYTLYSYAESLGQRLATLYQAEFREWSDVKAHANIEAHARLDIQAGRREVMYIIGNPNWKTTVLKYWKDWLISFSPGIVYATPQDSS